MKQGHADRSGRSGAKVEPRSRAVNPGAVADMGSMKGNHATDKGDLPFHPRQLYQGKGYEAPKGGTTIHKSGSQGRHR